MLRLCPVCRRWHNPESLCVNGADSSLREMGIKPKPKLSKQEFKELEKKANHILIAIIIFFIILFVASYIILNR